MIPLCLRPLSRCAALALALTVVAATPAAAQKTTVTPTLSPERIAALAARPDVGTCSPSTASGTLDVGDVRARLYNNGALFWKGTLNTYTVPKNGLANAIFTMGLWAGGYDTDGALRFAGATYGPFEYWPGPLDASGNPPADCSQFDRIWSVRASDIQEYDQSGQAAFDLATWPRELGAPTIDGDGDPSNYNLTGGDRPAIYGDQIAWWVMNDAGNAKQSSGSLPIGLEVRVTAHAFTGLPGGGQSATYANSTLYDYEVIYRGDGPLSDTRLGLFLDTDLGDGGDDFVGVDTALSLAYTYNSDDSDSGVTGYGSRPPALGLLMLETPDAPRERGTLHTFVSYISGTSSPRGTPDLTTDDGYDYLAATWKDGEPVTFGGNGKGGTNPTRYMLPGNAATREYWSEENVDNAGSRNTPGDRRMVLGMKPLTLVPGQTYRFRYALIWSRSINRLASVAQLRFDAISVRETEAARIARGTDVDRDVLGADAFEVLGVYPNPATESARFTIATTIPSSLRLAIYDVLGRLVHDQATRATPNGATDITVDVDALPPGVYLYRIHAEDAPSAWSAAGRFVVAR